MNRQKHLSHRAPTHPQRKARSTAVICLAGLLAIPAVAARADSYVIQIRQKGKTNAITLSCADDADHLCSGEIALSIDGHEQPVAVTALVEPGNAYLKFRLGDTYLFVASRGDMPDRLWLSQREESPRSRNTLWVLRPPYDGSCCGARRS